ncbi:MAG: GAF domain-containing protein [Candidatus Omnitrophica bacterium]|nr:GAF domain-containing protein [Candidatus Omnitrophota bacterium]
MGGGTGDVGSPALLELIELERWQRLQDHFASVLGVAIRTVSPTHQLLANPSWPNGVDADRAIRLLGIGEELEALLPLAAPPHEPSSTTTPIGVTYACVPIRATWERIVGYFVIGPVIVGSREDELEFKRRVAATGVDAEQLWPLVLSLKLYTFAGIRSVLTLLEEVSTALAQFAYQARQLAAILPTPETADQAVVSYHTDRVLQSLLEAAALATRADGGSVMVFDATKERLRIHAAQGLSDDVIARTSLRRGEGLAGWATTQRGILLLDSRTSDARLTSRMARRELVSSLVAPIALDPQEEPVGVLNLRTSDSKRRFTPEHVELLRRLLDLASAALGHLRLAFGQAPASTSTHST